MQLIKVLFNNAETEFLALYWLKLRERPTSIKLKNQEEKIVENVRLTACVQIQNNFFFHFQPSTGCFFHSSNYKRKRFKYHLKLIHFLKMEAYF